MSRYVDEQMSRAKWVPEGDSYLLQFEGKDIARVTRKVSRQVSRRACDLDKLPDTQAPSAPTPSWAPLPAHQSV